MPKDYWHSLTQIVESCFVIMWIQKGLFSDPWTEKQTRELEEKQTKNFLKRDVIMTYFRVWNYFLDLTYPLRAHPFFSLSSEQNMLIKQVYIQSPHFPAASPLFRGCGSGLPVVRCRPCIPSGYSQLPRGPDAALHFCLCLTLVAHSVHVTISPLWYSFLP